MRSFAIAGLAAVSAACAAPPLQGIGRPIDVAKLGTPIVSPADAVAPAIADFATRLARVGPDSFVSQGHAGGRYAASVYVTPTSKDSVFRPGVVVEPGTELVMALVDTTTHRPGPTLSMQKDPSGAWRYATGETADAKNEGLALCARCHAEAPGDHVFALPE